MCGLGSRFEATARLVFKHTHNKCVQWSAGIGVLNVELVLHPRPLTHSVRPPRREWQNVRQDDHI